jgi:hypothetical protein
MVTKSSAPGGVEVTVKTGPEITCVKEVSGSVTVLPQYDYTVDTRPLTPTTKSVMCVAVAW